MRVFIVLGIYVFGNHQALESRQRERPLPIDTNGFIWPTELKFMLLAPACFPSLMKSSDGNLSTRPLHTHCNLLALRENMEQFQPSCLLFIAS